MKNKYSKLINYKNIVILLCIIFVLYLLNTLLNFSEGFSGNIKGCVTNTDGSKSCENVCFEEAESCKAQNWCMYDSDCGKSTAKNYNKLIFSVTKNITSYS